MQMNKTASRTADLAGNEVDMPSDKLFLGHFIMPTLITPPAAAAQSAGCAITISARALANLLKRQTPGPKNALPPDQPGVRRHVSRRRSTESHKGTSGLLVRDPEMP